MLQGKVSSDVASKRQQCINGLKKFLEEQQAKLQNVLDQLDLKFPLTTKIEYKQICPYNKDHVIPEKSFKKHCETCRLISAGLQKDELEAQLQDLDFAYKGTSCEHKLEIDEKTLNKVIWDNCVQNGQVYTGHRKIPRNHIEENTDLTQEDRLALYHYVVKKSHEEGQVLSVDTQDELLTTDWGSLVKKGLLDKHNSESYSSKLEQLAALRDMKRRRQSYRAKNVHITKKSYTEIIREVIVNQMEILVPEENTQIQCALPVSERDRSSHSRHGRDKSAVREELRQTREGRSRSRDRPAYRSSNEEFLRDIKTEPREEMLSREEEILHSSRHRKKRKRSSSSTDSESSNGRSRKQKKSKHKKKHSKKHKRKD